MKQSMIGLQRSSQHLLKIVCLAIGLLAMVIASGLPVQAAGDGQTTVFKRIPTQFIAALGDPDANSGSGAQSWGR